MNWSFNSGMLVSVADALAFASSVACLSAVSVETVCLLVTAACFCSSAGGAVPSVVDSLLVFYAGAVSVVDSLLVLSSTVVLELVSAELLSLALPCCTTVSVAVSSAACTSCPLPTKKLVSKTTATRPIDNFRNPNFSFPFNLLLKLGSCL